MSVLKSKRKPSQFEVFHHLNKMRKEVTDLLLRDFGYDLDKAVKKVETTFGGRPYGLLLSLIFAFWKMSSNIKEHIENDLSCFSTEIYMSCVCLLYNQLFAVKTAILFVTFLKYL